MYTQCLLCDSEKGVAALRSIEERTVLEHVWGEKLKDVYICPTIRYAVKCPSGTIILPSLTEIRMGRHGYVVCDPVYGDLIYLSRQNLQILCPYPILCEAEEYVRVDPKRAT